MNSISIDEKKYAKAADLARELGYTADYVGQLCRAGKVDAQLVGRSWYVSEDSLRSHKKTRYRNDKKATSQTVTQSLRTKDLDEEDSFPVNVAVATEGAQHGYARKQFYNRVPQKAKHDYFSDESELIPTASSVKNKTGKLEVAHADAQQVKIKSLSKEYNFDPTPRPEIRFSGALAIEEVEDDQTADVRADAEDTPKDVLTQKIPVQTKVKTKSSVPKKSTRTIKVKHRRGDSKKKKQNLPTEHNIDGVIGMKAGRISDRNPMGGTLKIAVPSDHSSVSRSGAYTVMVSLVFSVAVSAVLFGLESVVEVQNSVMVTSYLFEIQTLIAAVASAW